MSVPHTGRLLAKIDGHHCEFNGNRWKTPVPALTDELNAATRIRPKHHWTISGIANAVFRDLNLGERAKIVSFVGDEWETELPPGAID